MKKQPLIMIICLLWAGMGLQAQDVSVGVKAGLSFSTISLGDKETDSQGGELEENSYVTGFHLGVLVEIPIYENQFGFAPELQFVQKGGRVRYEGPGSLALSTSSGADYTIMGTRRESRPTVNTYLSIPLMMYYRPIRQVRLEAGLEAGFLVRTESNGETGMTWVDDFGNTQNLVIGHDHNYYGDDLREGDDNSETLVVNEGNTTLLYPNQVGAYYFYNENDFPEKDGSLYNWLDLGLNVGASYNISGNLNLGFRLNYGLLDITNDDMDLSFQSNEKSDDTDRNISMQVSLGFTF